jgi:hypothetical protein
MPSEPLPNQPAVDPNVLDYSSAPAGGYDAGREPPTTKFDTAVFTTLGVLGLVFCLPFAGATVLGLVAIVRSPNSVVVFGTVTGAVMTFALFRISRRFLRTASAARATRANP